MERRGGRGGGVKSGPKPEDETDERQIALSLEEEGGGKGGKYPRIRYRGHQQPTMQYHIAPDTVPPPTMEGPTGRKRGVGGLYITRDRGGPRLGWERGRREEKGGWVYCGRIDGWGGGI